jgi:phage terminase Nu1 subunit (DNA packaging protein)
LQHVGHGVADVVDLVPAHVDGAFDEPLTGRVDQVRHLVDQPRQTVDELGDDESQNSADRREPGQQQ